MSTQPDLTVALVDDDASVRKSLRRLLRAHDIKSEEFGGGEPLLERHSLADICCIVLDMHMPGMDGLRLLKKLKELEFCPPIVFLTGHGSIPASVAAIKGGADDFLLKPVDENTFVRAIQAAREHFLHEEKERETLGHARSLVATLTSRELEVLHCVLAGARNRAIGEYLGITERTVKVHRAHIMEKLDVNTVADLAFLCARLGIGDR